MTQVVDPALLKKLVDPVDKALLRLDGDRLVSASGRSYPVVQGIPVMLVQGIGQTMGVAERTLEIQRDTARQDDPWQIENLGISAEELVELRKRLADPSTPGFIDPVVSFLIAATNGILYKHLIGNLKEYPLPELRLPRVTSGERPSLLDIGCNWGRWSLAAAKKGYAPIGLDPSLGAVLAGRRVARQLGLPVQCIVGDARHLPFKGGAFDNVFSYSVLQHFSKADAKTALHEVGRVLSPGGTSLIQMPNALGIRSLYHLMRRGLRKPSGFDVRYYTPPELSGVFQHAIGRSKVSVDGFFGLGIQPSDRDLMPSTYKSVIAASEFLRQVARVVFPLKYFADSVYLESRKPA